MDKNKRLEAIVPGAGDRSPTKNMEKLLNALGTSTIVPEADKYYVFVYKAKSPRIRYDQHPFVYVTAVYKWGFTGYNFHWEGSRSYTWAEVLTNLYEVTEDELNIVENYPIALLKSS